jgi:hypothetical protein
MGKKGHGRRLALREFIPMLSWVAAWAIVALAVGHADTVRLLAAVAFVRCARYLTAPTSAPLLRARMEARGKVHGQARRTVMAVEAVALLASVVVLALLIRLLLAADQQVTAGFCLILGTTLPARAMAPLAAGRKTEEFYQSLVSITGLILAAIAWGIDGTLIGFAIAFAAREWVALALAALLAKPRASEGEPAPLHWRQVADHSLVSSRRRFTYRVSKNLLKFVLGPFGSIAARTGRGFQIDRKLDRFVPRSRASLAVLTFALTGGGIALILLLPKPALLLAAATLMRVGASAGNILLWSVLGSGDAIPIDDEDDDD